MYLCFVNVYLNKQTKELGMSGTETKMRGDGELANAQWINQRDGLETEMTKKERQGRDIDEEKKRRFAHLERNMADNPQIVR